MQTASFEEILEQILAKDPRFHRDAYFFLRESLDFTQKIVGRETSSQANRPAPTPEVTVVEEGAPKKQDVRHVSGQQLLAGIREYALQQFGPMAITVFEEWGIRSCQDFGEIVFNMVESSLLAKTDTDSRADFQDGYDFYEAFRKPFLPQSKTPSAEPKPAKA